MLGAMIGDIVGSVYEWDNIKTTQFELFSSRCFFTDDTVLTAATAQALLTNGDYAKIYQDFARRYPGRGYGGNFSRWIQSNNPKPYNSWGNGSAMRISPVGFAFDTVGEVLEEAKRSAVVTHNHPGGHQRRAGNRACDPFSPARRFQGGYPGRNRPPVWL